MKTKFLLLFIFISTNLFSQNNDTTSNRLRLTLTPTFKINFFDFSDLNSRLKANNYPELSNSLISFGGSFNIGERTDKVFSSMSFCVFLQDKETDLYRTSLIINELFSNLEFNVLNKEKILLHPFIGVGFLSDQLFIYDKSINDLSFDTALSNLSGMTELNSGNKIKWAINLGAGFDYIISKDKDILLGIVAGYRLMISDIDWYKNEIELTNSPKFKLSGAYVGINMTFF